VQSDFATNITLCGTETFCMVALEAIACGCPLIVTDQAPEIARRFPAVPVIAPHGAEGLRRQFDAALGGDVPTPDHG